MVIERDCFELGEVATEWELTDPVIRQLVGKGQLRLSMRLVMQRVELSYWETAEDGQSFRVPLGNDVISTVADLSTRDAYALVRNGEGVIYGVELPDQSFAELGNGEGLHFSFLDALVRPENIKKLQSHIAEAAAQKDALAFDFRRFAFKGERYAFTFQQAQALRHMYDTRQAGVLEVHHLDILEAAGSVSQRLGSLFSRRPGWKNLLQPVVGHRGYYALEPEFAALLGRVSR